MMGSSGLLRCGKSSFSFVGAESILPHHHQQNPRLLAFNPTRITQSCAADNSIAVSLQQHNKVKVSPDTLDEWMNHSVSEIVRHIGDAPFLVHLTTTTTNSKGNVRLELKKENAAEGTWSSVKRRWREGCPVPDGMILVEPLDDLRKEEEEDDAATKLWGVLVQGKGVDTAACYILKTCRVWSSLGFCTHFCIVKAKCFEDTAELQLRKSWNGINL